MFTGTSKTIVDFFGWVSDDMCNYLTFSVREQKKEIREKIQMTRKIRRENIWISLL